MNSLHYWQPCLRLHASTAGGRGSITGWRTKIPQATECCQKINKTFKKGGGGLPQPDKGHWHKTELTPYLIVKDRTLPPSDQEQDIVCFHNLYSKLDWKF